MRSLQNIWSGSFCLWWQRGILFLMLCYPIMGSKIFPFGGGGRYLSVLVGPLLLVLLLTGLARKRILPQDLGMQIWRWALPFLPFVLAWEFIQLWHQFSPVDSAPLTRVLWGAVIYAGARYVGISRKHLAYAACVGAFAYFAIAMHEWLILGRGRVWGGVYENRFGQFSVLLAGLCFLHFLSRYKEAYGRFLMYFLPMACVLALVAAILSGSRGALAGLCMLLAVVPVVDRQNRKFTVFATLSLLGGCAMALFFPSVRDRALLAVQEVVQYFLESEFSATSLGIRLDMWRIALVLLVDHPFFGFGFTSFSTLSASQIQQINIPSEIMGFADFHSDWGKIMAVGGGLLLLSSVVSLLMLLRRAVIDPYRVWTVLAALVFSLSELFFCNKLGFSFFIVIYSLYAAAADNDLRESVPA